MTVAFKTGDLVAGRFKITQELGRGAMGVVYKAHDSSLDREVALKTIRFDVIADERDAKDFRERFLREARTAARLAHPNIVTIFDVGEWEGVSYMAIEYLNGVTLQELLRPRTPLPLAESTKIAAQICRALEEAHGHGIVHRDIKPANIMLVKNNQVKITDFGIAKVQSSATLTKEGAIVGTPSYMSPEQLSDKPVDGRADIFATGAVLYEMLAGERAFTGENITTVILKVVTQQPEPVRRRNPNLPQQIDAVIEKALQKDPNQRYQTMLEFATDLERVMTGASPVASNPGLRSAGPALDVDFATDDAGAAEPPSRGKGMLVVVLGVVGLLVIAAAILGTMALLKGKPGPAETPVATATAPATPATTPATAAPAIPPGPSAAVLPFESKGADAALAWLQPGLAHLFEADLAQSQKIRVVPHEEVVGQAATAGIDLGKRLSSDSIKKLAEALKVRTVLTGTFDVTGNVIRFDVYLYEAESGKILVTDYDKAEGEANVARGVDNLTIRVRDAMGALPDAAAGDPDRDVTQVLTANMEALKVFVSGRAALARKDNIAAVEAFKKATELDPTFAAAHAKLSQTYASMGKGELEEQARREAEAKAKAKADEDAKLAEQLKQQEAQRLEEMRKRAEERQSEEAKQKEQAEAEARRMAEAERRKGGGDAKAVATATASPVETPAPVETAAPVAAVKEGDLVEPGELTVAPQPVQRAEVQISPALKRRGEQHGLIIISALVNPLGRVEDAKVLRSDIPAYNDAALESVRKWTFSPPEKDGIKVRTWFTVTMKL